MYLIISSCLFNDVVLSKYACALRTAYFAKAFRYLNKNDVKSFHLDREIPLDQARTSSRKSVLSKPHFRNRSWYESSKLSMHFFKLEPEILICLPLVPKLIKNQSGSSLSSLNLLCKHHDRVINATL